MKYPLSVLEKEPGKKERTKEKKTEEKKREIENTLNSEGEGNRKIRIAYRGLERVGEGARKERKDERGKMKENKR